MRKVVAGFMNQGFQETISKRVIRPDDNSDMHALVVPHPPSSLVRDAEEWAAEIVKAVNNHDRLVAENKRLREAAELSLPIFRQIIQDNPQNLAAANCIKYIRAALKVSP
jgi:hypothetical protein